MSGVVIRPSQPIIGYLAREQALVEEEEKKLPPKPKKELTGFIGLEDDADQVALAFKRGMMSKRSGAEITDDHSSHMPAKTKDE